MGKKRKEKEKKRRKKLMEAEGGGGETKKEENDDDDEPDSEVKEVADSLAMMLSDEGFSEKDCLNLVMMTGGNWDSAMSFVTNVGDTREARSQVQAWGKERE